MRELKDFIGRALSLRLSTHKFPYNFPIQLADAETRDLKEV